MAARKKALSLLPTILHSVAFVFLLSLNGGQESAVIPRPHFGSDAYHWMNIYLIGLNVILSKSSYFCLTFFQTQAEHFLWCL